MCVVPPGPCGSLVGAADRYRSTTAQCAGTSGPPVRSLALPRRSRGCLVNRYQALFLPWVISTFRIAGTVIAAIENLRPGVADPHRPHRDGGSPDTDRPRPAREPGGERAIPLASFPPARRRSVKTVTRISGVNTEKSKRSTL